MKTKRRHKVALRDQFMMQRPSGREKVQIVSHGRPVSHIVITDQRGGAVTLAADFLPSMREVLEHISLINTRVPANSEDTLPN